MILPVTGARVRTTLVPLVAGDCWCSRLDAHNVVDRQYLWHRWRGVGRAVFLVALFAGLAVGFRDRRLSAVVRDATAKGGDLYAHLWKVLTAIRTAANEAGSASLRLRYRLARHRRYRRGGLCSVRLRPTVDRRVRGQSTLTSLQRGSTHGVPLAIGLFIVGAIVALLISTPSWLKAADLPGNRSGEPVRPRTAPGDEGSNVLQ